jgi:hypothetical protein
VQQGSKVTALTGVVVTRKAGRVRFRVADELESRSGTVRVKARDILYLLTYQGEGFTKARFGGRLYDSLDGTDLQVRDAAGRVGWTSQPEAFKQPGG